MTEFPLPLWFAPVAVAIAIAAAWAGHLVIGKAFARDVYSIDNAAKLLELGNTGGWNALRQVNADWRPKLHDLSLDRKVLPDIDFRFADLSGSVMRAAVLDGADFSYAILRNVDLTDASLRRAVFDNADLVGAKLDNAALDGASFHGAKLDVEGKDVAHQASVAESEAAHVPIGSDATSLSSLTPREFEAYVADVFRNLNFRVEVSPRTRDGGVDIILVEDTAVGPINMVVQVKRLTDPTRAIPIDAVRVLEGIRQMYPAQVGILVTNGQFTTAARQYAAQYPSLKLIDGTELTSIAKKAG